MNKICFSKFLISIVLLVFTGGAFAETVAMIGTGSVGGALGPRFASIGHQVIYGTRSPDREDVLALVAETGAGSFATSPELAAQQAQIVVMAVPWDAMEDAVKSLGNLSGKIIIDPSNPRVNAPDGYADYPSHVSNTEKIQHLAPNAMAVKAFSTISADTMIDPGLVRHPITIPLAGDSTEAKERVAKICQDLGYETLDVGPARYAHIVEGLYLIRANARLIDYFFEWNYVESRRPR